MIAEETSNKNHSETYIKWYEKANLFIRHHAGCFMCEA